MTDGIGKKKESNGIQICIGILALALACLIIKMMLLVSGIQGTARVVNYAGLVRGETQRIVKLEISNLPQDAMLQDVEAFIDGLRNGNEELDLVRLNDTDFQDKMQELADYFSMLRQEILNVRENGAENTEIISKSEEFFGICDEATGLAEVYSQRKATLLSTLEKYIIADIVVLMLLIGYEFVKAVRYATMNRALQHKVYLDTATGIPNKNKCEELLNQPLPAAKDVGVCSIDLNNLRQVNNSMGHEAGDEYIRRFVTCLKDAIPAEQFVGRAGGDEFLMITHGMGKEEINRCLAQIQEKMAEDSRKNPEIPLSYAVGYALACDFPGSTMRELFHLADRNMYVNKNQVKREEAAVKRNLKKRLLKLLQEYGTNFSDCLYCDTKIDTYRTIRVSDEFFLAFEGSYSSAAEQIVQEQVEDHDRSRISQSLQIANLCQMLHTAQDILVLQYDTSEQAVYNRLTVIPVDWDDHKKLHHFLLAFEMID